MSPHEAIKEQFAHIGAWHSAATPAVKSNRTHPTRRSLAWREVMPGGRSPGRKRIHEAQGSAIAGRNGRCPQAPPAGGEKMKVN
jgi:hypothetical protein